MIYKYVFFILSNRKPTFGVYWIARRPQQNNSSIILSKKYNKNISFIIQSALSKIYWGLERISVDVVGRVYSYGIYSTVHSIVIVYS